jgi:hypothetical protein
MFMVLLGLVFSKRTILESSSGVNDGATVGSKGMNWAGGRLFSSRVEIRSRDAVALASEPPSPIFA